MKFSTLIALFGTSAAIQHHHHHARHPFQHLHQLRKTPKQIAADEAAFENGEDPASKRPEPVAEETSKLPECEYVKSEDGTECIVK